MLRRLANVSLDTTLVGEATRLVINLSRTCEQGLAVQIAKEQARRWRAENAKALASSNAFVERNGLPLTDLRRF